MVNDNEAERVQKATVAAKLTGLPQGVLIDLMRRHQSSHSPEKSSPSELQPDHPSPQDSVQRNYPRISHSPAYQNLPAQNATAPASWQNYDPSTSIDFNDPAEFSNFDRTRKV